MMLPGPPSRGNGGCIDLSPSGLLAHGAGSSVVVSDPRSMQLLCVLPMPSSTLASFVTAFSWAPPSAPSLAAGDEGEDDHRPLRLAAGDRHGSIAVWDARARVILYWLNLDEARGVAPGSGGGVQNLFWIHHASGWLLASIHGPSLLCIWKTSNNPRVLWMLDASPEYLSCLRRDPFDARHLCALGLRGFLLSAVPRQDSDFSLQEHRVTCGAGDVAELQRLEEEISAPAPARLSRRSRSSRRGSASPHCRDTSCMSRSRGSSSSLTSTTALLSLLLHCPGGLASSRMIWLIQISTCSTARTLMAS